MTGSIPPHMQAEVHDAFATSRSSLRDKISSAGQAQSAKSRTVEDMSDSHKASGNAQAHHESRSNAVSGVPVDTVPANNDCGLHVRPGQRSSSPAKRLASDREELEFTDTAEPMDTDHSQAPQDPQVHTSQVPKSLPDRPKSMGYEVPSITIETATGSLNGQSDDTTSSIQDTVMSNNSLPSSASSPPPQLDSKADGEALAQSGFTIEELDAQAEEVKRLTLAQYSQPMEGAKGYVISTKWLARVLSRTTEGLRGNHPKTAREGDIGPVDNSDIIVGRDPNLRDLKSNIFIALKPGLRMSDDFEIVPEVAWDHVVHWYGLKSDWDTITRHLHNTTPEGSAMENFQFEVYPPIFNIRKLKPPSPERVQDVSVATNTPAIRVVASRSDRYQSFLKSIKTLADIEMEKKVLVWKVIETLQASAGRSAIPTPVSSRSASPMPQAAVPAEPPKFYVDGSTFLGLIEGSQRELLDIKDESMNPNYNGHLTLDVIGFPDSQTLVLEEQIGGPAGGEFVSGNARQNASKSSAPFHSSKSLNVSGQKGAVTSGRNSPSPSGLATRGRTRRDGRTKGCTGLSNLGNTCYMNSALQCIRSVEELSLYFLRDEYKEEINSDNPLGYGGAIAKVYAGLLHQIYAENTSSFPPRNFKNTLGRCQPLFSGYGQQDSQEFLSFLVDGLHEDLNRVRKKPYIENPESDDKTVHDPEAIRELGETFRANHKARNDSVTMDLFGGFYKNTMVCPECEKVSVTFDPFSLLTLQLPIENTWSHEVFFAPLCGPPVNIVIDMDKHGNINMLKSVVARKVGVSEPKRLVVTEVYMHKFYRIFEDNQVIAEANIANNDVIAIFEVDDIPTNFPLKKRKKERGFTSIIGLRPNESDDEATSFESPQADRMLVPLLHRIPESTSRAGGQHPFGLWPSLILITREEATSMDLIHRKVLAKIDTMTTKPLFEDDRVSTSQEIETQAQNGLNEINAAPEHADEVQASSVQSDDGLVDITMTYRVGEKDDAEMTEVPGSNILQPTLARSKVLDPEFFYDRDLNSIFDLHYYGGGGEGIAMNFSSINDHSKPALLSSRIPQEPDRRSSGVSWSDAGENVESEASSEDELSRPEPLLHVRGSLAPNSDSDSEQTYANHAAPSPVVAFNDRTKPTNLRRRFDDVKTPIPAGPVPLIRPGEGLVVDWTGPGYDMCFRGDDGDTWKGQETRDHMKTLADPELDLKKERRLLRKKKGVTLAECFDETAKSEVLSEENAWYCNRCKELRRATKTLEVWTCPDVLVLHLKRFSSTSRLRDKVDVLVDFPTEGLDLSGRVGLPEGKGLIYDLFAVDNHYGGLGGGHYTAYAQNFYDKKWYEYNDASVSSVNPSGTVTRAAYLLFYRRRAESPLGPPYLRNLVNDARNNEINESGEDRRPDDPISSHSGSLGASQEPAAGVSHPSAVALGEEDDAQQVARTAGSAPYLGGPAPLQSLASTAQTALENDGLPQYSFDDGPNMDDDAPEYTYRDGSSIPGLHSEANWSWEGISAGASAPPASDRTDATTMDGRSDAPMRGSEVGDDGQTARIAQDFGDEMDMGYNGLLPMSTTELGQMSHLPPTPEEDDGKDFALGQHAVFSGQSTERSVQSAVSGDVDSSEEKSPNCE